MDSLHIKESEPVLSILDISRSYTWILRASLSLGRSSRLDPFPLSFFLPDSSEWMTFSLPGSQCFLLKTTDHREHCSLTNAFGFSLQWPDCTLSWVRQPGAPLQGTLLMDSVARCSTQGILLLVSLAMVFHLKGMLDMVLMPFATQPASDPVDSESQPSV